MTSFIICTVDYESLVLCKKLRLPCFDASEYAEKEDDDENLKKHPELRRVSEAMSWIKPRLAVAVIGRGYVFWMVDLDMSWNSSPIPLMPSARRKLDLIHQCDSPARFLII